MRYRATLMPIGSEIACGMVLDTNSAFLAAQLSKLSFDVVSHMAVKDDPATIAQYLRLALADADLVVLTGGLGPTFDDVTKRTLAECFDRPLVFNEKQFRKIRRYFHSRAMKPHAYSQIQASFPKGCLIFRNDFGVAPGLGMESQGKWIVALPGVPREMQGMFRSEIMPFLKKVYPSREKSALLYAKLVSLHEVDILRKLGKPFPPRDPSIECGIYPGTGEVTLRMRFVGSSRKMLKHRMNSWKRRIAMRLGKSVVGFSDQPLEKTVGDLLKSRCQTLSIAESVTGGLLAKRLTDAGGASRFLRGGMLVYTDRSKTRLLGIEPRVLSTYWAVSRPVAARMARQARLTLGSTWGLATTGLAGPDLDGSGKPLGTVFVGLSSARKTVTRHYRFRGSRERIRWLASQSALALLREKILYG